MNRKSRQKTILIVGLLLIFVSFLIPERAIGAGEPVNTPSTIHLDRLILLVCGIILSSYGFFRK